MSARRAVLKYLEEDERFRERRNKDKGIANLLRDWYPALQAIPRDTLVEILKDNNAMDRAWRHILKHTPRLQGKDYEDKAALEQEAQLNMGYEPGYHQNVKNLSTLEKVDQQKLKL